MLKHQLAEIAWPDFGAPVRPDPPALAEYLARLGRVRQTMAAAGLTHLVVYGDREHFANLAWLTNFDPRFEEALLIISVTDSTHPLILVGNECESYLKISPLYQAGRLRKERYQPFSLPDQPMDASRELEEIFREEGLQRVGVVDWKVGRIGTPAWIVDAVRWAAAEIVPATRLVHRLRAICSPAEITFFEYTNMLAAGGMRRILHGLRDGILDTDLMKLAEYNGEPVGCHWTMKSGEHRTSLSSPQGVAIQRGGPFSLNVCYWGANVCRAGWVAADEAELPAEAHGYVDDFAGPYFAASAEWLEALDTGIPAGPLYDLIHERLPFEKYGIFLNPGHLIHLDEWLAAPFYRGSEERLQSGMAIQCDIIPSAPRYFSTRMEDGYVLVDESLQAQLRERYPAVMERIQARRAFMSEKLDIQLKPAVLPLSDSCGLVPPLMLRPSFCYTVKRP